MWKFHQICWSSLVQEKAVKKGWCFVQGIVCAFVSGAQQFSSGKERAIKENVNLYWNSCNSKCHGLFRGPVQTLYIMYKFWDVFFKLTASLKDHACKTLTEPAYYITYLKNQWWIHNGSLPRLPVLLNHKKWKKNRVLAPQRSPQGHASKWEPPGDQHAVFSWPTFDIVYPLPKP